MYLISSHISHLRNICPSRYDQNASKPRIITLFIEFTKLLIVDVNAMRIINEHNLNIGDQPQKTFKFIRVGHHYI